MESAEFKWREDDGRCPNCHNHCNLFEPSCDAGKRIAKRRLKKQTEEQFKEQLADAVELLMQRLDDQESRK